MPTLHRLACLRDDVVFLIYLYQKWIYKEDKRRRNEFGQVGEEVAAEDDATGEEDIDEVLLKELEKDKKPEEMKKNE